MAEPNRIKPVFVMNQDGLSDLERKAVLDGASEMIMLAGSSGIDLIDFGAFRMNDYKDSDGSLKGFRSVDWYVQTGRDGIRGRGRNSNQLNADRMQAALIVEPWRSPSEGGRDHYDILVVHDDMYASGTNFATGIAHEGIGATISTHRFQELENTAKYECIKTVTMHELGHVFGLIPAQRLQNVEDSYGKHCTNECIMRQGLQVPDDWIDITVDRLMHGYPLCHTCERDLKNYFG
jgi:predicted Zn-dependent protease